MLMKIVRHPAYTGVLLIMYGLPIFFFAQGRVGRDICRLSSRVEWGLCVVWASAHTASLLHRIVFEESCLAEHFGAEFDMYKAETWKMIPFVY
jgi:protein-S-isoprenylcysteine O-methyltransferase Ste14